MRGEYALSQGEALTFNLRLYLHTGDTETGDVGGRYLDYAFPPHVTAD